MCASRGKMESLFHPNDAKELESGLDVVLDLIRGWSGHSSEDPVGLTLEKTITGNRTA